MMAQVRTAALSPVRTWALSAKYRSQPRIPATHRHRKRRGMAVELPAPHRAEQESDSERNGERRVGPGCERFVDRTNHPVAVLWYAIYVFLAVWSDVGRAALV